MSEHDTILREDPGELGKTPWHLWVVGVLALIWNGFGAFDYVQTQSRNAAYLEQMMGPMGVSTDDAIAYYDAFPAWMDAAWALGVWGAVLGSVLLLLRNRFASMAFIVSFFGMAVSTFYGIVNPIAGMENQTTPMVMTAVIWATIIALILYSRRMAIRGVLK